MIPITRPAPPPELDLTDPNSDASQELRDLRGKRGKLSGGDFKVYKKQPVRDLLEEMHHGKCAYCEAHIRATQDSDVEHYRPKLGVTEAREAGVDHPGYWWLGMDWTNLLLSCQHCNQPRTKLVVLPEDLENIDDIQAFVDKVKAERSKNKTRTGKHNFFPTADNSWVTSPDDNRGIDGEKPLLLDPTRVDPRDHLDWVIDGDASTLRPRNGSPEGEATIRILALNRRWLAEDRRIRLSEMKIERNTIIEAMNDWLQAPNDAAAQAHRQRAQDAMARLERWCADNQPFAGLARAYFASVQAEVRAMGQPAPGG